MEFTHNKGDVYTVTGVDRDEKRFRIQTENPHYALGINLWRGSLWQRKAGEKRRRLLRRVYN